MGTLRQDQTDILNAIQIAYDETASGINSIEVQDAIDTLSEWLADLNGVIEQSISLSVSSNGTTITASVGAAVGTTLTFKFSDGLTDVDVSSPKTVSLTAGTDTVPQENFIYFLKTDPTTLVSSTSGFPTAEHAPVGRFVVQSAATVLVDGVLKQHDYTDHMTDSNDQGHLTHINDWIRAQHATWVSGVAPSVTGTGTATINVSTTSGVVKQLHNQTFPAMGSPADVWVVNDFATAYNKITNLGSGITTDSTGGSLTNRWYTLVLWGVQSQTSSGESKLFVNVPSDSYATLSSAIEDSDKTVDFSIPNEFIGTGFLIQKIVLRNNAGTTWTVDTSGNNDLRGLFPNTDAGSTTATATEFPDSIFKVFNNADNTKEIQLDASSITTATTRTIAVPDRNLTLDNITTSSTTNLTGFLKGDGSNVSASSSPLGVSEGGTGSATASGARTNLGLVIGTDVQAFDDGLLSIAGLTTAADTMIYTTALDTYATSSLTSFARTLLDDASSSVARTTLGVVIGTDVQAFDDGLQSIASLATVADTMIYTTGLDTYTTATLTSFARTLLDDASSSAARTTLGVVIGTDVQAFDAGLLSIAGLTTVADTMIYTTASDTYATSSLTSFARTLLDDASSSAARTTLGVVIGTDVQAFDAGLLSIAGLTTAADIMIYATASDTYATTSLTSFARTILDDTTAAAVRTTIGMEDFLDLGDTPSAYGSVGEIPVRVNTAKTGLEFSDTITLNQIDTVIGSDFIINDPKDGSLVVEIRTLDGNVGIGDTAKDQKLFVKGEIHCRLQAAAEALTINTVSQATVAPKLALGSQLAGSQEAYIERNVDGFGTTEMKLFATAEMNFGTQSTGPFTFVGGPINTDDSLEVSGTQVVGAQGAAVSDASGGATVDAEARTAINALLARVRVHGLIA